MKRIISLFIILMIPGMLSALGLGKLELKSALNEPFHAEIQLLSATANELDSLNVDLADSDAFYRAGIDRPFVLSQLRFKLIRSETGADFIRVSSQDSIREPFLNFLVEVNWANGRLFREYTVLLDPPLYDPNSRPVAKQSTEPSSSTSTTVDTSGHSVVYADDFEEYGSSGSRPAASPSVARTVNYTGGDYGPTDANDTLWSIASAMRPDSSISVNQMMLALLQANPDAFLNNNINGLKKGQILQMPSEADMNAGSQAEAIAEVNRQYAEWGQTPVASESDTMERPAVSATQVESEMATVESVVEDDPELKLLAAGESAGTAQQDTGIENASGEEMALAQESIEALTQENIELKDQLQESEALLDDLKRLLQLKDDELAMLQEQMGQEQAVSETVEVAPVEPEVIEEAPEPIEEELVEEEIETIEEPDEVLEEESGEVVEEAIETIDEEAIDVIEQEPAALDGVMDMITPHLAPITDLVGGNPLYALAGLAVLLLLIVIVIIIVFKKKSGSAETVEINNDGIGEFPEFDSDNDLESADDLESEAATILPGMEDEVPEAEAEAEEDLPDEPYLPEAAEPEAEAAVDEAADVSAESDEEEEDEDPLQEVNTYLAFEQFDQAEEFVRNAINDNPDNAEFHIKLLEVFYTSGNKKSYEEEAKALHDLVNGEGEHWDMAVAMWSEMSPNRALFEEGAEEEAEEAASDSGGGFVDVTADSEAEEDEGLDFDIGAGADSEEAAAPPSSSDDDLLDLTAAEDGEEVLDVTSSDEGGEDLLDVTAAVGLDDSGDTDSSDESEDVLDISGSSAGEDLLDLTAAEDSNEVQDVSDDGNDGGEDLLDVTAAANIELDSDEDLLDVTAATSAGADSEELLDLETEESSEETADADDNVIDFDLAAGGGDDEGDAVADEGLELDLTAGGGEDSPDDEIGLDLDTGSEESADLDEGLELDLTAGGDEGSSDDEISLDIDAGNDDEGDNAADEISLDLDTGGEESADLDEGLELDLTAGGDEGSSDDEVSMDFDIDSDSGESDDPIRLDVEDGSDESDGADDLSLDIDLPDDDSTDDDTGSIELDMSAGDDSPAMDETVEMPSSALAEDDDEDDDDDEEDATVFVPRASQPDEQTAEDEIATKLDLAKAYVELGDKDSAKTILDEVMADGNDEQKQQAQDLLSQV